MIISKTTKLRIESIQIWKLNFAVSDSLPFPWILNIISLVDFCTACSDIIIYHWCLSCNCDFSYQYIIGLVRKKYLMYLKFIRRHLRWPFWFLFKRPARVSLDECFMSLWMHMIQYTDIWYMIFNNFELNIFCR